MSTRTVSNKSGIALVALLAGVAATSCGQNSTAFTAPTVDEAGSVELALSVSGLDVSSVTVEISNEDSDTALVRTRTFDVSDQNATISAQESGLVAGNYTVKLSANVVDDESTVGVDESTTDCSGSVSGVVVAAGQVTEVNDLVLKCVLDGGEVLVTGGLRVNAEAEFEKINQCPDLFSSAFIAPLSTSAGSSVALGLEPIAGATVSWSAARGSVSADGTSYNCPSIPGNYTVTATVTDGADCTQTFSEVVSCHSGYEGTCEALPSAFVWEGSCGLRSPCHLISQDGCDWSASCRGQIISGEGTSATSFPFAYSRGTTQLDCTTELVDGELVGTCENGDQTCSLNSNQAPAPSANCEQLLSISSVTACGISESNCDVIQEGCSYQAKCADGTIRTGNVVDSSLRWNMDDRPTTGNYYRCEEPIVDGNASGSCRILRGDGPATCDDFSADVTLLNMGGCAETLPSEGFKLAGCGLDGVGFATQRECVWEIVSTSGTLSGVAPADNTFEFSNPAGQDCVGSVVDGKLGGTCGTGEAACSFAAVDTVADSSCFQLPEVVATRGCGFGAPTPFGVVQDGCEFYGFAPSRGVFVAGDVLENGITFPGIGAGWVCTVELDASLGDELYGGCLRDNADGSVSQCRDLTADQGSRLVVALTP